MTTNPFSDTDTDNILVWLANANTLPVDVTNVLNTPAVQVECDSEEAWLAARKEGLGASEIGVVMGASRWTSPYALWWRKKLDWRIPRTEAQQWGHLVEEPITALFAQEMAGQLYIAKPVGHPYSLWHHPLMTWALCTPDRLAVRLDGEVVPVELKSDEGGDGWGKPGTSEVPPHHRFQSLWQAFIFGAPGTYVVRKRGSGKRRMVWYWVPFDGAEVMGMLAQGWEFLRSITQNNPPDPDGSAATTEVLQDINPVEADTFARVDEQVYNEWSAARAAKRDAVEADRLASNRMRAAMGTAQYATVASGDGLDVIRVKRRIGKRDGYTAPPTTVDELRSVNGEQRATDEGVRAGTPVDPPPMAAHEEEGHSDSGHPGDGMGESPAGEDDPRSPSLTDVPPLDIAVVDGLPPELARLVRNALDAGHPLGLMHPPERDSDT